MSMNVHSSQQYLNKQSFYPLMHLLKNTRYTLSNGFSYYNEEIKCLSSEQKKYIKLQISQINSFIDQLMDQYDEENSNITEFMDTNHKLSQENKLLFQKLKQAQNHIQLLTNQTLAKNSKNNLTNYCQKCSKMSQQIKKLQQRLIITQQQLSENTQELVAQLHQKKQKLWKMQGIYQQIKNQSIINKRKLKQCAILIQKLRKQNIQSEIQIRNMKKQKDKNKTTKCFQRRMTEASESFENLYINQPRTKTKPAVNFYKYHNA